MKFCLTLAAFGGGLLVAASARAQIRVSAGPRVGLGLATVHFAEGTAEGEVLNRFGFEAGVQGALTFGHFAVQPAVLYAQQGFRLRPSFFDRGFGGLSQRRVRLDYLTLPVQLAYNQRVNGRGLQVFAGPYVSFLTGGRHDLAYDFPASGSQQQQGKVAARDEHLVYISPSSLREPDYTYYTRRLDVGAQAGVGYRLGGALVQISYTLGLRNLATAERYTLDKVTVYDSDTPAYRSRALLASFTYLVGSKH